MQEFQQRVAVEADELKTKLDALNKFSDEPLFQKLPVDERIRLRNQRYHMTGYHRLLRERIAAFGGEG